ncbi:MAG: serine hydrolase domain-containing protein, partial [Bacteroidota bacterium]
DSPEAAGLAPGVADAIDAVLARGLASGAFPGASVAVGRGGVLVKLEGYGGLTDGGDPVTPDTPYDLASLTKVVATTSLAMRAAERGDLDLDAPVRDLVPTFRPIGGDAVTPRHLLSHTAGHRPFWPFFYHGMTPEAARAFIHADTLQRVPGERVVYSDFDMIVLGEALETASGETLEALTQREVTGPLGMSDTEFRAVGSRDLRAAPTERDTLWRQRLLQGEVHDEAAALFGGVSGHAGLFSTARDMARFGFTMANGCTGYGHRLASGETLERFTRRVSAPGSHAMGLGWMLAPSARGEAEPMGRRMGPRTFGHTGFTGTSIWIDPDEDLFIVLLTNRIYPTRERRGIRAVRADLADAVASRIVAPVR